jgi:DNA repair protein RecO (recombination protein O)
MAEITKNEAIVLRKTNFSETSLIVQLYTKEHGKISAMIKGARSSKSKIGSKVDTLNWIEVVFYNKEEKELQLVTQANLVNYFQFIKSDLDKLKYASAICELIIKLVPEKDANEKLFRGVTKMLSLINQQSSDHDFLFTQFLIFFIKEIGFELSFSKCPKCSNEIKLEENNAFSFSDGVICGNCNMDKLSTFQFSTELFNLFMCLTSKNTKVNYKTRDLENIIFILEKYLIFHNPDFKGIQSLKIL